MHLCGHIAGTAARTGSAPRGDHQADSSEGDQQAADFPASHLHPELFCLGFDSSCNIGRDRKSSVESLHPREGKFFASKGIKRLSGLSLFWLSAGGLKLQRPGGASVILMLSSISKLTKAFLLLLETL